MSFGARNRLRCDKYLGSWRQFIGADFKSSILRPKSDIFNSRR